LPGNQTEEPEEFNFNFDGTINNLTFNDDGTVEFNGIDPNG